MENVNRDMVLKSGDKFAYDNGYNIIYTLQKFPDFDLWMLISQHNDMWMQPMDTPFKAFGGWHQKFMKID